MALVYWLIARIEKVKEWFGAQYDVFLERLKKFYHWLEFYATMAYNWARSELLPKILGFFDLALINVRLYYDLALEFARNIRRQAFEWIDLRIEHIRGLIFRYYDLAIAWTNHQWTRVEWLTNQIRAWAQAQINAVANYIYGRIDQLFGEIRQIRSYTDGLDRTITNSLIAFIRNEYASVLEFVKDPVGYIFAVLRPYLLDFMSWLIAYSLGSTQTELPPFPSFNKNTPR